MFRARIAAHLVVTLTNPPLMLIVYELFKVGEQRLTLGAAFFGLVATAVEAASLVIQADHPVIAAYDLYTPFFGLSLVAIGYLVFRSGFLPRAIACFSSSTAPSIPFLALADILAPALPVTLSHGASCRSSPARDR